MKYEHLLILITSICDICKYLLGYDRDWNKLDGPLWEWKREGRPKIHYEGLYPRLVKFCWGFWEITFDENNHRSFCFYPKFLTFYRNGSQITGFSYLFSYESLTDGNIYEEEIFVPVDFNSKLLPWKMRHYKLNPSHPLYSFFVEGIYELEGLEKFHDMIAKSFSRNLNDPNKCQTVEFLELWFHFQKAYQILVWNRWIIGHTQETLVPGYYLKQYTAHETQRDFLNRIWMLRHLQMALIAHYRNVDNLDLREFNIPARRPYPNMDPIEWRRWTDSEQRIYSQLQAEMDRELRIHKFRQ